MAPPPPPKEPSELHHAAVAAAELGKGRELAALLEEPVELIADRERRATARAALREVASALSSSLSVLESDDKAPTIGASFRGKRAKLDKNKHAIIKRTFTHAPETDGFHWRKYGEKKIHGCKFPRLYYRCGYYSDHKCPAKKQVQQLSNENHPVFSVTSINGHTCNTLFAHQSTTASSSSQQLLDFTTPSLVPPWAHGTIKTEEGVVSANATSFNHSPDQSALSVMALPNLEEVSPSSSPYLWPDSQRLEMERAWISSFFSLKPDSGSN